MQRGSLPALSADTADAADADAADSEGLVVLGGGEGGGRGGAGGGLSGAAFERARYVLGLPGSGA